MEFTIGQKVMYHKVIKSDGTKIGSIETEITSKPWMLGHSEWVIKLKGVSGGVSLNHIEPINQ